MYERDTSASELAAFGLLPTDYGDNTIEIWPENEAAVTLFTGLSTQWRTGMAGPTGLDYNVLFHRMDRMNLTPERYTQIERDVYDMEIEALTVMAENAKEANQK